MAVNDNARLRQLVSDYYHGLITPDSYRQQRADLLDNIGAQVDEQSDTITNRRKPTEAEVSPAEESAKPRPAVPESASGKKRGVIIASIIAGIVVVGFVVATQMFELGTAPGSGAEAPVSQSTLARGDALIDEFLSRKDWSDDSLSNFLLAWGALDDDQRQLAYEGRRFRVLTNVLHRRIREETALDSTPGGGRLDALKDFAVTLGAPYRESLAPAGDEMSQEEVVVVEQIENPSASEASEDDAVSALIEDTKEEPASIAAETPPAEEAKQAIEKARPAVDDPCPAEIANTRRPYCQDVLSNGSTGPALVVLPTGSFEMGNAGVDAESPAHRVEIAYHVAMSRFEITVDEYAEYCDATNLLCPDSTWGGDYPVVSVSWDDAVAYTDWLSETTGFSYRLPSEAEWEFAARAGTQSPYSFGDTITPSAARSSVNGLVESPLPLSDRTVNRNPFRLYHMSGNIREWTLDAWYPSYENTHNDGSAREKNSEDSRAVRGGSYSDPGDKLRSAAREPLDRSHRDTMTGFRVVREVLPTTP